MMNIIQPFVSASVPCSVYFQAVDFPNFQSELENTAQMETQVLWVSHRLADKFFDTAMADLRVMICLAF
jgi:hypothetical protein